MPDATACPDSDGATCVHVLASPATPGDDNGVSAAPTAGSRLRVAFYNTENLFDCRNDSLKDDAEYLPEGIRRWTTWRYWHKLQQISSVIASLGGDVAPEVVGLCEVENDSVMRDLTRRSLLRQAGYRYVMTHCDDPRGIDVALMYRPSRFRLLGYDAHPVPVKRVWADAHARDILHVWGEVLSGDTLDVLVCHWPSRRGGARYSAPLRALAAEVTGHLADSLESLRRRPYVLVMGDLNDGPENAAVRELAQHGLVNMAEGLAGSYRYRGKWEQLDQMLLSPLLADTASTLHVISENGATMHVMMADFLLECEPTYGGWRPMRTFRGRRYKAEGYSDHLPVYMDLVVTPGP